MMSRNIISNLYEEFVASREMASDTVKREPSLILVGETPTDASHPKMEARIVKEYGPGVVLLEDASKESEEDLNSFVNERELWQCGLEISTRVIGIVHKIDLKGLLEFYIQEGFWFVGEPLLLLDKSLGDLNAKERLEMEWNLLRLCSYTTLLYNALGLELERNATRLSVSELERWISNLEKLQTTLENILKTERTINVIWEYKDRAPLYEAIREVNAKPAGCGVSYSKIITDKESKKICLILLNAISQQASPETLIEQLAEELYEVERSPKKESIMAKEIKGYVEKSKKPVVAIVKKYHLRENSWLLEGLKGIEYQIIELPETERSKEKELHYKLRRVNKFLEYIFHRYLEDDNPPRYTYGSCLRDKLNFFN